MTTIACNRKEMAADSQETRENGLIVSMSTRKVRVLGPDRDIVACQGRDDEIIEFEAWWDAGRPAGKAPELGEEDGFAALVLTREGRIFKVYERLTPVEVPKEVEFMALGSADGIAMGAMAAGKNPAEAIAICCDLDNQTGGLVTVEKIE